MKKILTVSIMAVMAVTAANAEIASKAYVDQRETAAVNSAKGYTDTKIGTLPAGSTDVADAIAKAVTGGIANVVTHSGAVGNATTPVYITAEGVATAGTALGTMATENAADYSKTGADTTYAKQTDFTTLQSAVNNAETGLAATKAIADANKTAIGDASSGLTKGVADNAAAIAALGDTYATDAELTSGLATKQDTITAQAPLSHELVSGLGSLATASTVTSADITDGTIATADIADEAVTAAKLSDEVNASLAKADTAIQQADRDSAAVSATTKQVVTGVSMTDGVLAVTSADPLTNAAYDLQTAGQGAGKYALTAIVNGSNEVTGYKWELIQRAE